MHLQQAKLISHSLYTIITVDWRRREAGVAYKLETCFSVCCSFDGRMRVSEWKLSADQRWRAFVCHSTTSFGWSSDMRLSLRCAHWLRSHPLLQTMSSRGGLCCTVPMWTWHLVVRVHQTYFVRCRFSAVTVEVVDVSMLIDVKQEAVLCMFVYCIETVWWLMVTVASVICWSRCSMWGCEAFLMLCLHMVWLAVDYICYCCEWLASRWTDDLKGRSSSSWWFMLKINHWQVWW